LVWVGLGRSGLVWSGSQGELGAGLRLCRSHVSLHFPTSKFSQNGRPLPPKTPLLGCSIATLRSLQAFSVGYAAYWATYAGTVTARAPVIPQLQPPLSARSASMCLHAPLYAPLCASLNPPQPQPPPKAARRIAMGESGRRAFVPQIIRTAVALLFAPFACFFSFDSLTLDSLQQIIMQLGPRASRAGFALSRSAKLLGQWTISIYLMKLHAVWLVPWALSEQKIMLNRRLLGRLPAASYRPLSKRRLYPPASWPLRFESNFLFFFVLFASTGH
jgi:hypothetical protein